jgi:transcriptional regulator of acetoin/glycerol metabolism
LLFGGNGAPPQPRTERGDGRIRDAYDPERLVALLAALARHGGNLSRAVQELGLSRSKGYRMLRAAKRSRPSSAGR